MNRAFRILSAIFLIGMLFLWGQPAFAQEKDDLSPSGWSGDAEIGYLMTSGNTETKTLNAMLGIRYESAAWRNSLRYETIYGAEESEETGEDVTTNQRFLVSGKSDYRFNSRNSVYGLVLYEDDRFSGYEYQATLSAGYNRQIIDTDKMEWSAEIGPGYRFAEVEDADDEEEFIVHLASLFLYQLSDTATFSEEVSVDAGAENTITRSKTSLKVKVNDHLAMKVSFGLKHTSDAPEDTASTDTETALTLVFGF